MNDRANDDEVRKVKASRPWRHVFLQLTLAGTPELQLFESDEQRKRALDEIGKEAGRPAQWTFVLAVVLLAVAVYSVSQATEWVCAYFRVSQIELPAKIVTMGLTFLVTLRWLHRWGSREELRQKLLEYGIPVCMKCGYSLRGLSLSSGRCPECGTAFDDRVREILAATEQEMRNHR